MEICFQIAEHSLPYAKVTRIIDYKKDSWLFRHPCKFFKIGYLPLPNKIINFANVIKLDRHIEILLLENDCVIVPGLGGFVAHHVSARYDVNDGLFLPPYRTLGFNAQLKMNDSLLVQSYVDAYDMSYPEALRKVESEVDEIYRLLGEEGFFELTDLGRLSRNHEGKLTLILLKAESSRRPIMAWVASISERLLPSWVKRADLPYQDINHPGTESCILTNLMEKTSASASVCVPSATLRLPPHSLQLYSLLLSRDQHATVFPASR